MKKTLPNTDKVYNFHYEGMFNDFDAYLEISLESAETDSVEFDLTTEDGFGGYGGSSNITWYSDDEFAFDWTDLNSADSTSYLTLSADTTEFYLYTVPLLNRLGFAENDTIDDLQKMFEGPIPDDVMEEFNQLQEHMDYYKPLQRDAYEWFSENELRFKYDSTNESLSLLDIYTDEWILESD